MTGLVDRSDSGSLLVKYNTNSPQQGNRMSKADVKGQERRHG